MSGYNRDIPVDKNKLLGMDYRLFQRTSAWNLAKAVQDENTEEIKRIVREEKVDIDYQEERFGKTLLMHTVRNQQYEACKTLLELGANPNIHDTYNGSTALIDAARIQNPLEDNTRFLKLLLAYGADPNEAETGERQEGNTTRNNPLLVACSDVHDFSSPLEKVKVLVEAGADVNYRNEYKWTPLSTATVFDHFDVILYLIQQGADYRRVLWSYEGQDHYLWDQLRTTLIDLDDKKYKDKMELVDFLKEQGIDYRALPIPDYVKDKAKEWYPDSWQEYLEKY